MPLSIFAFTICRYIAEEDPQRRLEAILQQPKLLASSGLERTYLPILNQLIPPHVNTREQKKVLEAFRELVGPIIALADPLSAQSLSRLLGIPLREIGLRLRHLNSVFNLPNSPTAPIRLFHLSFHDFLVDPQGKDENRFWIDEVQMHRNLAECCLLRLMEDGTLRQDLCSIKKPGSRRSEVSRQHVTGCISDEAAYACCYWVWHLSKGEETLFDDGQVHHFLRTHFLHWLEALSWLGRLSSTITYISDLRNLVVVS